MAEHVKRAPTLHSALEIEAWFGLHRHQDADAHHLEFEHGMVDCRCAVCMRWKHWVRGDDPGSTLQYEILTFDLVNAVAAWICKVHDTRQQSRSGLLCPGETCTRVLEVGAGDGRLSWHIRAVLDELRTPDQSAISIVATDSGERSIPPCITGSIELRDYRDALREHAPHIVICSWMPLGRDWTAAFRECTSVSAYLLLGECDDGASGDPWATWGFDAAGSRPDCCPSSSATSVGPASLERFAPRASTSESSETSTSESGDEYDLDAWRRVYEHSPHRTPWGAEGWTRQAVHAISAQQIGRTDSPWCSRRHSTAVCFSRASLALPHAAFPEASQQSMPVP